MSKKLLKKGELPELDEKGVVGPLSPSIAHLKRVRAGRNLEMTAKPSGTLANLMPMSVM